MLKGKKKEEEQLIFPSSLMLEYSPESAASRIITEVPIANDGEKVKSVINRVINNIYRFKTVDYIYILDDNSSLVGVISIKNLLGANKESKIESVMKTNLVTVSPDTDEEKVADLAVKHNIKSIPVIENGRFVGVVPIEKILPILNMALREDLLHLAGIHKAHLKYENTLTVPVFSSMMHRIPWLIIGLIGITMAALFMSAFEATLQQYLVLAFFIPAIVYMSDALGTQHQTLFIRDLAVLGKELNLRTYFIKQMLVSSLLAIFIGALTFLIITVFWNDYFIAIVISISMFATLIASSISAFGTTIVINKLNLDPALGSGPLATIISDVSSIIIYFAVAYIFLGQL